jgi:hypothetical protein
MIELIEKYICKKRNIPVEKIREQQPNGNLKRNRELVMCRQLIVYYAMANGMSEREAGDYFNKQDHSTAHHAKKKIRDLCDIYRDFAFDIAEYDKVLIGLTGLNDKKILNRLEYDRREKVEYVNKTVRELTEIVDKLTIRINDLRKILSELKIITDRQTGHELQ